MQLEKQVELARHKAAECQKSSRELRKLLEKRDKENSILHVRSTKLQQVSSAAETQIRKQADTIRRLEVCLEMFENNKVYAEAVDQQHCIVELRAQATKRVR